MQDDFDIWIKAVLKHNHPPAWLFGDAPYSDVAISSRVRIMRNLKGFCFPHACNREELEEIENTIREAISSLNFEERRNISEAEKALLVGSRLISPDFVWPAPGHTLFLNSERSIAIMINEEDHIRLQAVTAGYSIDFANSFVDETLQQLAQQLDFAWDKQLGFLAASPINIGEGKRYGAMLHVPGIASNGTLRSELMSYLSRQFDVRGLMGETSAGVAAYLQISTTSKDAGLLKQTIRHLIDRETQERVRLSEERVKTSVNNAIDKIQSGNGLTLDEATRCVGWLRLGAIWGMFGMHPRELDALLALIRFSRHDDDTTNRKRASLTRKYIENTIKW